MTDRPTKAKENPVQRRRRVLAKWRLRQIVRSIPKTTRGKDVLRFYRIAQVAAGLNRRLRARVALPWLVRPYDPQTSPDVRRQLAGRSRGSARRAAWALDASARVARGRPRSA
jgi:hypothetical protein